VVYASGLNGYAGLTEDVRDGDMRRCSRPCWTRCRCVTMTDGPLQMQIISLDYSSYVGKIGVGRITRGRAPLQDVVVMFGRKATRSRAVSTRC
jgi:GTP-binding protein